MCCQVTRGMTKSYLLELKSYFLAQPKDKNWYKQWHQQLSRSAFDHYHTMPKLLRLNIWQASLHTCDAITQAKCNALGLRSDANVACQLPIIVILFLHGNIYKRILTEYTSCIQIRSKETTLLTPIMWGEAPHIG
mmetsp:Transcript_15631/g.32010  ORF Transcript_15631/g.32010 Transcript_15631/m.32010 type:complete len:135 (+) Transcript_15631:50-454(+)